MASAPAIGTAKSMAESRAEALQALLNSLAPGAEDGNGGSLNKTPVRQMSDRLGELLGDAPTSEMSSRNAKGELLNEEGLPIIDIVEPMPTAEKAPGTIPTLQDPDGIPLWALSASEKARRRAERDLVLDALEEEERIEQAKEEAEERARFAEDLEKRKRAAEAEMAALKKAREMQKKMGKALLRNLAEAREREEKEKIELEQAERQAREERQKLKPKKSVTFADLPPDHEHQPANSVPVPPLPEDWGDVALGALQGSGKSAVVTRAQMELGPMRTNVVERLPGRGRGPKSPPPPSQPDSDDETDPGSEVPADSDDGEIIRSDQSDSDPPPSSPKDECDETDFGVPEDHEPVDWDDESYNYAQHQREIALAYYEKRATLGAEALAAMRNHNHTEEEHEWDQPVVPLEATLASSPPKPAVSRFKASRSSASSSLPSHSLGVSVLPASQSSTLKAAVRLGKLEDGNLVGGDAGESDDEVDPATKEILELFQKGDVTNVGPNMPRQPPSTQLASTPTPDGQPMSSVAASPIVASARAKTSRTSQFKRSLTEPSTPLEPSSSSTASTPIATSGRSSPKLALPRGTPVPVPTKAPRAPEPGRSQNSSARVPMQMPGMIVDSPSFPAPGVISSPSFPGPSGPGLNPSVAAFESVILDSPSFSSSSSTAIGTPVSAVSPLPASGTNLPAVVATTPLSASVLERRPIVASSVRESAPGGSRSAEATPVREKKVSRFLAGRT